MTNEYSTLLLLDSLEPVSNYEAIMMQMYLPESEVGEILIPVSNLEAMIYEKEQADRREAEYQWREADRINEMEMWGPAGRPDIRMML